MEEWIVYDSIKAEIAVIDSFTGGNREVTIKFINENKSKFSLYFDNVFDFRYAIENAFIDRFALVIKRH